MHPLPKRRKKLLMRARSSSSAGYVYQQFLEISTELMHILPQLNSDFLDSAAQKLVDSRKDVLAGISKGAAKVCKNVA